MKFIFIDLKGEENMKKFFVTLMASMLLLSSTTYAVEMSKSHMPTQMTTMSKSEAIQMLKDAGVEPSKIAMLENGEMAKTEGEFWWLLIPIIAGIAGGIVAGHYHHRAEPLPTVPGFHFEYGLGIATY